MALNPQTTKKEAVKAALTILLGLAVIGVFIIFLGGYRFWEKYDTYHIEFATVKDLSGGRPVKFAGLDVGRVRGLVVDPQDPTRIVVTIDVKQGFALYEGTLASISQKGLVGDNYVLLELERPIGAKLAPGATIRAREQLSMTDVAERIGTLVADLTPKLAKIADNMETLLSRENVENVSAFVQKAPVLLEEANTTLVRIRADFSQLSQKTGEGIDEGVGSLKVMSRKIDTTLGKLQDVIGGIEREINLTLATVREDMGGAFDKVGDASEKIQADLEYDLEKLSIVLDNVDRLARDMRELSQSLRERPWQVLYTPERSEE